jgi:hypothetical protein
MEDTKFDIPKINGYVKIEKFDENGNCVFKEESDNHIKSWVYSYLKNKMASAVASWNPRQAYEYSWDGFNTNSLFRYVYLLNSTDTGNSGIAPSGTSEPCFPLPTGDYIGYLDRYNQTLGSNYKLGLLKYDSSYCTPNSAVFVYEWSPGFGTGTFDTVIHASDSSTTINDGGRNDIGFYTKAVSVGSDSSNAIWKDSRPSTFCLYKNESNQLIMCHTPTLNGLNLEYTERNIATGVSTIITVDNWNNAFSGSIPNRMCIYFNSSTKAKTILFSIFDPSSPQNRVCYFNGTTWATITTVSCSNYGGVSIDANYVYFKEYNNTTLARYSHAGTNRQTIVIGNSYCLFIGSKVYDANYMKYWDLSSATWSGETIASSNHKYSYPDIGINGTQVFDGSFYTFLTFNAYVTGEACGGQSNSYALVRIPIEEYKQVETAHYKGTPINKGESETLRITYTFNIS